MNKKLLAVAIGAALSAPMLAQADVKVGGTFNVSMDYLDTSDGVTPTPSYYKQWNVSSNSSFIKIDVSEDLSGGMKAYASLQEFFRLDNTGATITDSGKDTATVNRMTDGIAYVGLQTSFGSLQAGAQDSMAKTNGGAYDLFRNSLGDSRNLGVNNNRVQNVVAYVSPTFAGVTAVAGKSTNVDNTVAGPGSVEATTVLVKYAGGPVTVGVAMDSLNNAIDTQTINLGASFAIASAKINAFYQKVENLAIANDEQTTMGIGASFTTGNHTMKAQYYTVTDATAAGVETDAKMIALGYDYAFSKTFKGYVVIAQTEDGTGGSDYGMAAGGHGDQPAVIGGETMNGVGIGAIINF